MLDLNLLKLKGSRLVGMPGAEAPGGPDMAEAYQRYLLDQSQRSPGLKPMTRDEFERYSLGSDWLGNLKQTARKVVQTCRLMVGIQDYDYYLEHMRTRHPGAAPLSRQDFYRYCLDARFPGGGGLTKCPC